ncbi:MAG: YHYH protein [Acidimicrobiia bacterium]|nr:YHYH protein [Acidimicrobiia bacterium]
MRFRDSCARGSRALAVAGLLLGAGCAAATGPRAIDLDAEIDLLDAWLIPETAEAPAATLEDGAPGDPTDRFELDETLRSLDAGDFVVLEGIPEPPEPTPVAIRVNGLEVLTLDGETYVAVRVMGRAGEGDRVAGLFPVEPSPATTPVATGRATVGLWVTGTPFANWSDGGTYRGAGIWRTVAPGAVGDDGFSCAGPAADESAPHVYPECLALHLGDDSGRHSPIYGFAADGYPVHGPWADLELLARSSWRLRDYDTADSATGCGEVGRRTCLLADPLDPAAGTVPAPAPGPTTAEIPAGAFFEDYWFDIGLDDGAPHALDAFNGHAHDELGYHYHITRIQDGDGSFTDVFPYIVGPWFRGELRPGDPHADGPRLPEGAVTSRSPAVETVEEPSPPPEPPVLCVPRLAVCD